MHCACTSQPVAVIWSFSSKFLSHLFQTYIASLSTATQSTGLCQVLSRRLEYSPYWKDTIPFQTLNADSTTTCHIVISFQLNDSTIYCDQQHVVTTMHVHDAYHSDIQPAAQEREIQLCAQLRKLVKPKSIENHYSILSSATTRPLPHSSPNESTANVGLMVCTHAVLSFPLNSISVM